MRSSKCLRTKSDAASAPASRYTAPITASKQSDKIEVLFRPPALSSPLPSKRYAPRSSERATSASARALTTAWRRSDNLPSALSSRRWYAISAIAHPSTASPRNSSRSFEIVSWVSANHERCTRAVRSNEMSENACPIDALNASSASSWTSSGFMRSTRTTYAKRRTHNQWCHPLF